MFPIASSRYRNSYCGISLLLLLIIGCGPADNLDTTATAEEPSEESFLAPGSTTLPGRWTVAEATDYYQSYPWQVGANYNPRNAINQLDWWQAEYFDTTIIREELGWAADIGMNSMRVYLHNLVWEADSLGLLQRMETYLSIADDLGISTVFVLFDSVWDPIAQLGPQPEPRPHLHNSGWVQSPPARQLKDPDHEPYFESYIKGILSHFRGDRRIFAWDLYNEPDNHNFGKFDNTELPNKEDLSYELLKKTFAWAREVSPTQPITAGVWFKDWSDDQKLGRYNRFQVDNSDLISFHHYGGPEFLRERISYLKRYDRPLLCTEYMARTAGSTFQNNLPILHEENIAAYNWGLVKGESNTIYPWASWDSTFVSEPPIWFHDVFHPDGRPYSEEEVSLIRELSR